MTDWRPDLDSAIARGLDAEGLAAVEAELSRQADRLRSHPDAAVEPLRPEVPVLGVAECTAGHLGVLLTEDGRISVHVAATRSGLLDQVRETAEPYIAIAEAWAGRETTAERRERLRRAGLAAPGWYSGSGFTESELLDACDALLAAVRRS